MNETSGVGPATPADATPKLYGELAAWWPLLSAPEEYVDEAAFIHRMILESCAPPPQTLLELGSGGGTTASHLKAWFQMTLVDRSPGMLAVSRGLNPECEHVVGDMRAVRLGRLFDGVVVHDAIMYMTTEDDLRRAMETSFVHCRPGGAAIFLPDFVHETFRPGTDHGGHDAGDRGFRFMEWAWDPDPGDNTYVVDYAFLLREGNNPPRVEHDRHVLGLFPRADWLRLLAGVGYRPRVMIDSYGYEVFVADKPGGGRAF